MPAHATKIATCCYCGTRAALVLNGKDKHELACSSCGAPLHMIKHLPLQKSEPAYSSPKKKAKKYRPPLADGRSHKPTKRSKKKGWKSSWFWEEAFDLIEDIFD
jgi:hypothetical protein